MRKILFVCIVFLSIASTASAVPVMWSGNGHYYDYIFATMGWEDAVLAADDWTYLSATGYLATVTSSEENAFINSMFNTEAENIFVWIGGHEPEQGGGWFWGTGPEAGTMFWPEGYSNWGELTPNPDSLTQNYVAMNLGARWAERVDPGEWADFVNDEGGIAIHYLVEFDVAPIPEPTTMLLLGFGLVGIAGLKRKR